MQSQMKIECIYVTIKIFQKFFNMGLLESVLMKLSFIFEAEGEPKYGLHSFQKP